MSSKTKEWISVAAAAATAAAFLALVWSAPWPRCKPGDPGFYIGGSMLLAGCPEKRR